MIGQREAIKRVMADFERVHGNGSAARDLAMGSSLCIAMAIIGTLLLAAFAP